MNGFFWNPISFWATKPKSQSFSTRHERKTESEREREREREREMEGERWMSRFLLGAQLPQGGSRKEQGRKQ